MSWPLLLLFFTFPLYAQTLLEPIEVEAIKDIERFTFATSETVSTRKLEAGPIGLTAASIERVPGVITSQNGGPGGRISFFIRGTESRHVSFLLDGLKINDTSNTDRQFDAAFMTSPFIQQMTIHKGPQAVLYGSDALGGVVEMKTRRGENAPETRLTLSGGSFGTIQSSLANDWKAKKQNGTLTVSRFHSDGISRLNKKRYDSREKDATDITQATSSSEHRWGNKFQTDLLASYLHAKAEQDGFATDSSADFSRNDQYIFQQKTQYELRDHQAISLRNGFNRHQRHNESLSSKNEFFNGDLYQHEIIHRLEMGPHGVISGIATEHEAAKAISMDRSFDLHSAFLQSAYQLNHFKFHAGGRLEKHSKYGSFLTGAGGIGIGDFSFQYSQGFKAPSLYQLYGPDSFGSPVGNLDLVPETNHSMELAWRRKSEKFDSGIALFQNRLNNQFTYSFTQGYLNQKRYIAEGVELSAKYKEREVEIFSSFTHQQFREEESVILRRPYNAGQLGLSYFPRETIEINVTERWFSSRKDFGTTEITKLNGYEVMDFSVRKSWEKDDIVLMVKNVLNREYEDLFGFSTLPRSAFFQYAKKF